MRRMSDYTPSPPLAAKLAQWAELEKTRDELRVELRGLIAEDLKNTGVTAEEMAAHVPWTRETVRGIAREYAVPHKRKPTVRSIKPQKRTTGRKSSG